MTALKHKDTIGNETFDFDITDRESYKFWHKETVRFNDLDALGHVNNVRFNEYLAGARTKLFFNTIPNWPKGNIVPYLKLSTIDYREEV